MKSSRSGPSGIFSALVVNALAVLALALMPAVASGAEMHPESLAMGETKASHDESCAPADETARHAHGANCLAACLSAHGALLPEMPVPAAALPAADRPAGIAPSHELPDHPFGLDPPPPRRT